MKVQRRQAVVRFQEETQEQVPPGLNGRGENRHNEPCAGGTLGGPQTMLAASEPRFLRNVQGARALLHGAHLEPNSLAWSGGHIQGLPSVLGVAPVGCVQW